MNKRHSVVIAIGIGAMTMISAFANGAGSVQTTITCAKNADQVDVSVHWTASPSLGYRIYGRPNIVFGDWEDYTDQLVTPGSFTTNLPNAQYFFHAESYELPSPSANMVMILAGTTSGTDPDFGSYSLTVGRFWLDTMEVSKEKWDEVALWASVNDYEFYTEGAAKAAGHPVHSISYIDSVLYCNARSEMEGRTPCYTEDGEIFRSFDFTTPFTVVCDAQANGYRLPTNDEWEYAARGNLTGQRFPWGNTITHANANYYAYFNNPLYPYDATASAGDAGPHHSYWFIGDIDPYTAPVGDLPANGYGLHNMSGNMAEFTNPDGDITKSTTIYARGGSWNWEADKARIGDKSVTGGWLTADSRYGFRTVVSLP